MRSTFCPLVLLIYKKELRVLLAFMPAVRPA
jgi:hypothetical protein